VSKVAARALALVGVRFRLHGRDAAGGLDCVGVAAASLRLTDVPTGYALRGGEAAGVSALLDARLARADGRQAGDVLLFAVGAGQLHLAVATVGGVVHADAGLGRVVERPGVAPWALVGAWRSEGDR
jgi:hypothetical protein